MSVFKNEAQNPVKVQFKKSGKVYNVAIGDGPVVDEADKTSYPFDEVTVAVGESVDLGAVTWSQVIEVTPFSEAAQKSLDAFVKSGSESA